MLAPRTGRALAAATIALLVALAAAIITPHGSAGGAAPRTVVHATEVACGANISTSTTLANDLSNCAGGGIDITGSNVVLNLNGHRIGGGGPDGVLVDPGRSGVTIENGTISGFTDGITVHGNSAKVLNMRVTGAGLTGVMLFTSNATVSGSTIFENGGAGVRVNGTGAQILNDAVRDNGASGVEVDEANATLTSNRVLSNADFGIDVEAAGAKMTSNTANGNGSDGIRVNAEIATLSKNVAFFNTKLGVNAEGGVTDSGGNRADGNGSTHQCKDVVCS